ncbi:MAG TPA: monofunctional biosynthetic peptidoglycan transglycosylase [Vicinamibacteria bacterium]|nr:monofunctional biosynthetic peptidoglycan transglycosylase [Vicinamibacteria bacterium]
MKRALLVVAVALAAFALYLWWGLPSRSEVRALAQKTPGRTAVMLQREEEARDAGRKPGHSQAWVPLSRVSRNVIHAVLSSEDQKFFGHEGVDWDAVRESVEANRKAGRFARGGSTLTQQLAKNLFFSTHKSLVRKARELLVSRWLEQDLSKARILELYLNVIEWGDGVYGCEAAARRYYGKSCATLDETEAAGLAAMIPNPRRINPRVNAARHARAQRRVLWLMAHAGYLKNTRLGSEPPPPPEPVEEDEPPASEPEPAATASLEPPPLPTEPTLPTETTPPPPETPTPDAATPVPTPTSR